MLAAGGAWGAEARILRTAGAGPFLEGTADGFGMIVNGTSAPDLKLDAFYGRHLFLRRELVGNRPSWRPGDETQLTVQLADGTVQGGGRPDLSLDLPPGLESEIGPVWVPTLHQASWRLAVSSTARAISKSSERPRRRAMAATSLRRITTRGSGIW